MLSQDQEFDKIGGDLDYNMFHSDGTQIDIAIYDVEIVGDSIFFSVDYKDDIVVNTPYEISTDTEIKLLNKDNIYKPIVEMFKFSSEDLVDVVGDKMYFKPLLFNSKTE